MPEEIRLSALNKTWILDLDGTVLKHNGYKTPEGDRLLDGAAQFLSNIREGDLVIFITSREERFKEETEAFLCKNGIRFNHIIYNAPYGERVLINDRKPSGLPMAFAVNPTRDIFTKEAFVVDENL